MLANGEVFGAKGKIMDLGGQFDASTGTIAMRAVFTNPNNLLRNGEMGDGAPDGEEAQRGDDSASGGV